MGLLQSGMWWLRRPALYPEAVRVIRRRLNGEPEPAATDEWDARRHHDTREVWSELGLDRPPLAADKHAGTISLAAQRVDTCPTPMGGGAHIDLLYGLARATKPTVTVETGVAYGWSSLAILLALDEQQSGRLISIDRPYPNRDNDRFVGIAVPRELRARWELIRKADRDALPQVLENAGPIDLAHYDSDKRYRGRRWAYDLLYDALRPGGVFVSDDVNGCAAFEDFCADRVLSPLLVEAPAKNGPKLVGIVMKPMG